MHFIAPKKALVEALAKIRAIADKKSSMPALANVLIEADDAIRLSATDLYLAATSTVDVKPKRIGAIAAPAHDLFERVRAMPEGDVEVIAGDDCAISIKAVGSARRYTLHGLPGGDFPKLPRCSEDAPMLQWTAGDLSELIERARFAISTDETRSHVNSMLLEATSRSVRAVATDGHRLALAEMPWQHVVAFTGLIPLKAVAELRKLLAQDGPADAVELRISGPHAFWTVGGADFSCKLVDAQFPPYQQVIPAQTDRSAIVPRTALSDAVRAVAVAASDRTGGVKLRFERDVLHISAKHPDAGDGSDEVAVEYSGAPLEVVVNSKYLLDALSAYDDDQVTIGVSGELDPIKITSEGGKTTQVCMPMRLT